MPRLDGSTHINLTVTDLDRSTEWYCQVFGLVVIDDITPPHSGFHCRTLLHPQSFASVVLGQAHEPDLSPFDERRTGLHHLAYHVPERSDLDEWARHLDASHIPHSGVMQPDFELGAQIWLRDPDNIWLELYWLDRKLFTDRLRQHWRERRGLFTGR